jgi:PE-PPE domain
MTRQPPSSLRRAVTAIGLTAGVIGLAATQPQSIATIAVAPAALIVAGSSTNQAGEGIPDFYGARFKPADPDDIVYVHFLQGPDGIVRAVQAHDGESNVIISSGWGAGNASVALTNMAATDDPALADSLWVLDNSVVNPNGGFGTRYPLFSSLVGVPTEPTPIDTGVPVISTAYVYDVNSNAPAYVSNVFSQANSYLAWFQRRVAPDSLELPVNDDGTPQCPGGAPSCTVTTPAGTAVHLKQVGDVTYVTYEPDGLPLVAPLRAFGDPGNTLADVVEPPLTALVNWGYPDNDPVGDPSALKPARLFPTPAENRRFVDDFAAGVQEGLATLRPDKPKAVSTPTTLAAETSTEAAEPESSRKPLTNVVRESVRFMPNESEPQTSTDSSAVETTTNDEPEPQAAENEADPADDSQDAASRDPGSARPANVSAPKRQPDGPMRVSTSRQPSLRAGRLAPGSAGASRTASPSGRRPGTGWRSSGAPDRPAAAPVAAAPAAPRR